MKKFNVLSALLVLLVVLLSSPKAMAVDLNDLQITTYNGDYTPIAGTVLGPGDSEKWDVDLPFSFEHDGSVFDKIRITSNGNTQLFSATEAATLTGYSYTINYSNTLAPMCEDFDSDEGTGDVRWDVIGTSPNRTFVAEWKTVRYWGNSDGWTNSLSFQLHLEEGSNVIKFVYGNMTALDEGGSNNSICFITGNDKLRYINLEPTASEFIARRDVTTKFLTQDDASLFPIGKTIEFGLTTPILLSESTENDVLWKIGETYPAPSIEVLRLADMPDFTIEYTLTNTQTGEVIYTATNEGDATTGTFTPNPQPVGIKETLAITHAIGKAAAYDRANPDSDINDGSFDLITDGATIVPGRYELICKLITVGSDKPAQVITKNVQIALENDLAVSDVKYPRKDGRYLINNIVPLQVRMRNYGTADISSFSVTATIYDANNDNIVYGPEVYDWQNAARPLHTGDFVSVDFPSFRTMTPAAHVGQYYVVYTSELLSDDDDMPINNNIGTAASGRHYFDIVYDVEPGAVSVEAPNANVFVGRPLIPRAKFINNGIVDLSNIPAVFTIVGPLPSTNVVYQDEMNIQDLQAGNYNVTSVPFISEFIPELPGTYKCVVSINSPNDKDLTNNTVESTFNVETLMSGTYTISANGTGTRNFTSIKSALDMLYLKGVDGPVTFELLDPSYEIGSVNLEGPALDMSSRIIGVSDANTITFKPSDALSTSKASINFNLKSANGIGIYIAQNFSPRNTNAAVHVVTDSKKNRFANSGGYIIFDGGSQKSFKFNLETKNDKFASVFYLGSGASNCQIKNCIITDDTPNLSSSLPLTVYNAGLGAFTQEADQRSNTAYYTAAVVLRSVAPLYDKTNSNFFNLDTLTADNNVIANNEISGFGYGIASMGTGLLFEAGRVNKNTMFYNANNVYESNSISNVGHAGVFVGFEEGSEIRHNRIYDVQGTLVASACGIVAGGEADRDMFGYNTVGLKILGNEISNLTNANEIYGIKVDQSPSIVIENNAFSLYPKADDNVLIANNSIWQLNAQETYTTRVGVAVFSQRATKGNFQTSSMQAFQPDYVVRNTNVVNNTIVVNGDDGVVNSGSVIGLALQDNRNAVIKNNAIAVMDNEFSESCLASAALYLQNGDVKNQNVVSDRNVFWTNNSASTIARMVETDEANAILNMGHTTEYNTLNNWMVWSGQDMNSVESNFMTAYEFVGAAPQSLRVKSNPLPLNSVLNNRGDRVELNTTDLLGNARGEAGQRYDIGALEFNGRSYVSDVESTTILEPAAFKANDGTEFGDAEYIMTSLPLSVKVRVRNNGSLMQQGTKANLSIYRELPNGDFAVAPEYVETVSFDVTTNESTDVVFDLNGKFEPKTYSDLRLNSSYAASVPSKFVNMTANVTPRYKIEVSVENDEDNYNNIVSKNVRYFIRRSWLRLLVTSENVNADLNNNPTQDVIASALNHSKLIEGLNLLGWDVEIDPTATDIENDRFDYDVLDRNSWEPRAIEYSPYNSVIWSDANDTKTVEGSEVANTLTRFQEMDLNDYIAAGTISVKKNLIFASQELLRNEETGFSQKVFAAYNRPVATPDIIDYSNVSGMSIGRNLVHFITATNFTGDAAPQPALMTMTQDIEGVAKLGFYYTNVTSGNANLPESEKIHTVGTVSPKANRILLGSDWRHFADIEKVLRSLFDFAESNGGTIIPVELVNFDANVVDNKVVLNWATASELNSDRFEIERTTANNGFDGLFGRIESVNAAGKSGKVLDYNAVDYNVSFGNTYAYRLKMIDRDGKFEYSNTEYVILEGANSLTIKGVTPNPVVTDANVSVSVYESANVEMYLVDMSGKVVANVFTGNLSAGSHIIKLNAADIASGNYTLVLNSNNIVRTITVKIVK